MSARPTMEQRVRFQAGMLIKVKITRRRRSRFGFVVEHPRDHRGATETRCTTRSEALQVLFAKVRTAEPLRFIVRHA